MGRAAREVLWAFPAAARSRREVLDFVLLVQTSDQRKQMSPLGTDTYSAHSQTSRSERALFVHSIVGSKLVLSTQLIALPDITAPNPARHHHMHSAPLCMQATHAEVDRGGGKSGSSEDSPASAINGVCLVEVVVWSSHIGPS